LPIRRVRVIPRFGVSAVLGLLLGGAGACCAQPLDKLSALALVDAASTQMRIDPEAGRRQLESALNILHHSPDADVEIRAHLLLSDYYMGRDRSAAQLQISAADALLVSATRPGLVAGVLNCRGKLLAIGGNNDQAALLYEQAVGVAEGAHDDEMLAEVLLSRGVLRGLQGSHAQALTDLRRALGLFEEHHQTQRALITLNAIGIAYNRMGDAEEATHIFQRTLEALRSAGLKRDEAATLRAQGDAYQTLQQWSAARSAYSAALELSRQTENVRAQAYELRGLADVATAQDDASSALELLDKASEQQIPDTRLFGQIELSRGVALHRLNRQRLSLAALSQALASFRQLGAQSELAHTYNELAAVNADMGNWRDAFDYRSLSQTLTAQLLRSQLDQRFASLKVEFDTASKEKENLLLTRENAADQAALAQRQKASNLQTVVIILTVLLLALLATVAVFQRRNSLRLRLLAMTDELTGIPNRRAVLSLLSQMLRRQDEPHSILIIDVDHFKSINDRHGHLIGDEALKQLSANLRSAIEEPAFFGRLGGEEFAAVLPGTNPDEACAVAEDLRERVLRLDLSRWLGDRRLTVSIGIATSAPGHDSVTTMLRRADSALYCAKDAGRNCVRSKSTDEEAAQFAPRVA
jgi:diguanylate cyclase (GGDEF)-like protein